MIERREKKNANFLIDFKSVHNQLFCLNKYAKVITMRFLHLDWIFQGSLRLCQRFINSVFALMIA